MNAADSSCRTSTNLILSLRRRSASIKPLMPSPGSPNITSTPQSNSDSATISAVLVPCVTTMRYYMSGKISNLTHKALKNVSYDSPFRFNIDGLQVGLNVTVEQDLDHRDFLLCESCFWCASYIDHASASRCPVCKSTRL